MPIESSSLRVLLVAVRYFPYMGGSETHVYEVGRRLARAGVEVTVLTTDVSGRLPAFEEVDGVRIHRVLAWPTNKDYYFAPAIYRFIARGQWDLVHCQGYHSLVPPLAMLAAWRAKLPYVLTFHSGGDVSRLRSLLRGLQRAMLRPLLSRARKLIAVSAFEADFFREQLRLPGEQFVIIPNGAYLPEVPGSAGEATDEVDEGPLIVSIGRLERYKGHQRVIAALPKVLELVPNVRVRIAGVGPYESALQKMARKLGVAERVEIRPVPPGDRGSMASLLARADLVTLLSQYESQGIAVLEALALRRPVLVTATSALQELADRGLVRTVPLNSTSEAVATAMVDQLRHPLVPPNVELPMWDDCAANLLALYQTIVQDVTKSIVRGASCVS
ncbi:MAG: glycosyltransferase family 4 protein [Ktedonobacteraceae bacterium]|nr:glycosyltransferase family 4 protein [Ktedonobacteraceae bacterium]